MWGRCLWVTFCGKRVEVIVGHWGCVYRIERGKGVEGMIFVYVNVIDVVFLLGFFFCIWWFLDLTYCA